MTDQSPPPEQLSPAEQRLRELLVVLMLERVEPGHALAARIARKARWQGPLREHVRAAGVIAATVADALRMLVSSSRREKRR